MKKIFLFVFCVFFTNALFSKDVGLGFTGTLGFPQNDFKKNVNRLGYGLDFYVGFAPERVPILIGVDLGFLNYGSSTRQEPFSTTIPDVTVDVKTSNDIFLFHPLLRIQPNIGIIRPYIEGLIGLKYLTTTTEIQNQGKGGEEVASSTNKSDNAFSYGGGAGLMIRIVDKKEEDKNPNEIMLEFGARYLFGNEAEYLKEGSIRRVNGAVVYDVQKSTTDLLNVYIGLQIRF